MKNYFISLLGTRQKILVFFAVAVFIGTSLLRIASPVLFKTFLDALISTAASGIWKIGIAYAVLYFVRRILEEVQFGIFLVAEQEIQKNLMQDILKKTFHVPFSEILNKKSGEYSIIIDRGLSGLRGAFSNILFLAIPVFVELLAFLVIFGFKAPIFAWFSVTVAVGIFLVITPMISSKIQARQEDFYAAWNYNFGVLQESIQNSVTVRGLSALEWMLRRFGNLQSIFIAKVYKIILPMANLGILQGGMVMIIIGITIFTSVYRYKNNLWTLGDIVMVNGLLLQVIGPLQTFANSYKDFIGYVASLKHLGQILDRSTSELVIPHQWHSSLTTAISVKNLNVFLSGKNIIGPIDLCIKKGSFVVITGKSGAGKSLFAKALCGLIEYDGEISLLEGTKRVAYLSQDAELFDLDLFENISLSDATNHALAERSLREAGLSEEESDGMKGRPLGERGRSVSGGQRQRIGLARLLYHDADVLILDEPTASLDETNGAKVMQTICKIAKNKTVILITHDLRFPVSADYVYKMQDGTVLQEKAVSEILQNLEQDAEMHLPFHLINKSIS